MKIIKSLIFSTLLLITSPIALAEMVNINEADATTIAINLKGIGEVKAKSIVEYRKEHGKFEKIDDLTAVKGIGNTILEKIREEVSLKSGITRTASKQKPVTSKVEETIEKVMPETSE